jgi:hypothetical protein
MKKMEKVFIDSVIKRFREEKALGDKTMEQLDQEALQWRPNETSNSIAIIIQHLHGNMLSRWTNFLTEDGEKSWRMRDAEFEPGALSKEDLLNLWEEGWNTLLHTLTSLQPDDLLKTVTIRSQPLIVVDAINRQLAHYSYHTGQIVQVGKWLLDAAWQNLSIPKGASVDFNSKLNHGIKS